MSNFPTDDNLDSNSSDTVTDGGENEEQTTPAVRRHPTASKTPFDYPFVFPGLLFVLGCWFGYDGWFNPEMEDHRTFNRVLFWVFAVSFVWTLSVDYRVYKILKQRKAEELAGSDGSVSSDSGSESSSEATAAESQEV